jgi:hypothetical protein
MRIAMLSGPRTVSTAMLRAWGNRADTAVWDEPLYAHYLQVTGKPHPGAADVLAAHAHEVDASAVTSRLAGPIPDGKAIWYQKHIAQHLLPDVDLRWVSQVTCAFLIRDPARMLASLWMRYPEAGLADTGLSEQVRIFEQCRETTGITPSVIDSDDVRRDPRGVLSGLCQALGVPFDEAMLSWAPGPRASDGAWGPHWYDVVWKSTGFAPPPDDPQPTFDDPRQTAVLDACQELYDRLSAYRIRGDHAHRVPRAEEG